MIIVTVACPVCGEDSTFYFSPRHETFHDRKCCPCDRTQAQEDEWSEEITEKGRAEAAEAASYGE